MKKLSLRKGSDLFKIPWDYLVLVLTKCQAHFSYFEYKSIFDSHNLITLRRN